MLECSISFKSHMGQNKSLHTNKCEHMVIAKSNPFCLRSKQRLSFWVLMAPGHLPLTLRGGSS
jgi:hypothetical protein